MLRNGQVIDGLRRDGSNVAGMLRNGSAIFTSVPASVILTFTVTYTGDAFSDSYRFTGSFSEPTRYRVSTFTTSGIRSTLLSTQTAMSFNRQTDDGVTIHGTAILEVLDNSNNILETREIPRPT